MRRDRTPLTRTYYTPVEAAELVQVSDRQIRNMCAAGQLPCVRIGRYWRLPIDEFKTYLASRLRGVAS